MVISLPAGPQQFSEIGHWIDGIGDQLIFNGKFARLLNIMAGQDVLPDDVNFDLGHVDPALL